MEVSGEGCNTTWLLPVGYRFVPTDEEIITFLGMRILNQPLPSNKVKEVELYDHTPQQLEEKYGERTENEMYFFTQRKLNSATATRANRTVYNAGYWRASTKKLSITDDNGEIIGHKMLLNYYVKTETKVDTMTTWLMYEYTTPSGSKKMDELVLCKIYNKRNELKHKITIQREECRQNMVRQAPTYQSPNVGLHNQSYVEPPSPTNQVSNVRVHDMKMGAQAPPDRAYDHVGHYSQSVELNFNSEPTDHEYNSNVGEPINGGPYYHERNLVAQAAAAYHIPDHGDALQFQNLNLQGLIHQYNSVDVLQNLYTALLKAPLDDSNWNQFAEYLEAQLPHDNEKLQIPTHYDYCNPNNQNMDQLDKDYENRAKSPSTYLGKIPPLLRRYSL